MVAQPIEPTPRIPGPAARKLAAPFARKAIFEQLEPRFLLSADLNPLVTDALFAGPSLQPAEFRSITDTGLPQVVTTFAVAPPIQRTNEIVFVDTATPDYQRLVEDMRNAAPADGRSLRFVLIDADSDGLARITETLAQQSAVDAVHVISHARDGAVQLGGTQLDLDTVTKRAGQIASWGLALTAEADILFYGCDLAATQQGQSLIDAIARLTEADVAASEDLTGHAALGGDWTLEFTTGRVEAQVLVSAQAQQAWMAALAPEVLDFDTVTWPGGLAASYAVGAGNVALTVSGSTGQLNNGAPTINTTNTGGLAPAQNGLFLSANFANTTQSITLTIAFTHPGGVSNVGFSIFDIDTGVFVDQIVVTGNNGAAINPSSVVAGSLVTFDGVNTVTGTSGTTGDARSNARFTFNQAGITSITLLYRPGPGSPANPDQQYITVHDISFASAPASPQVDLNGSDASVFAGEAFGTAAYNNASTGTIPWNGNWTETDAAGGAQSATAGNVQIITGELRMTQTGSIIQRAVNLGAYTADNINRLSFDYRTNNQVDATTDLVYVEVSSNGGSSWTTLDTLDLSVNASGSASYDITAHSTANTVVRFRTSGFTSGTAEYFYLDNVAVSAQPTSFATTYTENAAAVSIADSDAYINDDSANMSSMTISIASVVAGDTLTWTNQAGIMTSYDSGTGVLTATGSASRGNYQALLRSVQYSSSSEDPTVNGTQTTRTISVVVTDSSSNVSNTARSTITVAALNDAPVIGGAGSTHSYSENAAAVTLEPVLTVTDADDTQIASGSVTISAGFTAGDTLTWTNQVGITANYNGATGVLSLSGAASLTTYQALLRSVAYSSTSDDPSAISASRTITWSLTDANSDSVGAATGTATTTVNITAINDPPVNTVPGAQATVVSVPLTFSSGNGNLISVADAEAGTIQVTLSVTSGTVTLSGIAGLSFSFSDGNGVGAGDGTADALMRFRGTQAAVNAALAGMSFVSASVGSPTLTITTSDLGATGTGGTLTDTDVIAITVAPATMLDLNSTPSALTAAGRRRPRIWSSTAICRRRPAMCPTTGRKAGIPATARRTMLATRGLEPAAAVLPPRR